MTHTWTTMSTTDTEFHCNGLGRLQKAIYQLDVWSTGHVRQINHQKQAESNKPKQKYTWDETLGLSPQV
jgi:hypothetical protein